MFIVILTMKIIVGWFLLSIPFGLVMGLFFSRSEAAPAMEADAVAYKPSRFRQIN